MAEDPAASINKHNRIKNLIVFPQFYRSGRMAFFRSRKGLVKLQQRPGDAIVSACSLLCAKYPTHSDVATRFKP